MNQKTGQLLQCLDIPTNVAVFHMFISYAEENLRLVSLRCKLAQDSGFGPNKWMFERDGLFEREVLFFVFLFS